MAASIQMSSCRLCNSGWVIWATPRTSPCQWQVSVGICAEARPWPSSLASEDLHLSQGIHTAGADVPSILAKPPLNGARLPTSGFLVARVGQVSGYHHGDGQKRCAQDDKDRRPAKVVGCHAGH